MIIARTSRALALIILGTTQAMGQSADRLTEMENAVFAAAAANPISPREMSMALTPVLGTLDIRDISDRELVSGSWGRFEGQVLTTRADLPPWHHDITCTTVSADVARRIWHIDATSNDRNTLPETLKFVTAATPQAADTPDLHQVTYCTGALHLGRDEADPDAMAAWFDRLFDRFTRMGLEAAREPSRVDAYPAGFLRGHGRACDGTRCVLIALPWAATWAGGTAGQVALTVLSVKTAAEN